MNDHPSAKALFDAGRLAEALTAATEEVRRQPTDTQRRLFLAELLSFQGEIERADSQLDVIVRQHPDAVLVLQFRQLLRAEKLRDECHTQGRAPEFLAPPPEHLQLLLRAVTHWRSDDVASAARFLEQAEAVRPEVRGTCGGTEFSGLRDLDDLSASCFEVLTGNGRYYWVPFESVARIEFHCPAAPRDLIWRRASLTVHDGPDGEVFVPALYFSSRTAGDDNLRCGRGTDWVDREGIVCGVGQRVYLVGDEDRGILELTSLEFQPQLT
jgi:type VI secretion system protein ImpE